MKKSYSLFRLPLVAILAVLFLCSAFRATAFENVDFIFDVGGPRPGKVTGYFNSPDDLAVGIDGTIYVTDGRNFRVQYFDTHGIYKGQFGGRGKAKGNLGYPFGIEVGPDGSVYVSDRQKDIVKVYDSRGAFSFSFGGSGLLNNPCGIAIDNQERVIIADSGNNRIAFFTLEGVFLYAFGTVGQAKGELKGPCYLAVDQSGRVYVSETGNKRVQVFTADGNPVAVYGGPSDPGSPLRSPAGLSVTTRGILAVVDNENGQIAMLDPGGKFKTPFGSPGAGRGQFNNAGGVRLLDDGRLYVADTGNNRIQGFKTVLPEVKDELPSGPTALRLQIIKVISSPVTDVAVTDEGIMYLLDGEAGKVHVVDQEGREKSSFGPGKDRSGNLKKATGIGLGPDGRVYVYDSGDNTFKVFDQDGRFNFEFGGYGKNEGKFAGAQGFCFSKDKLFVADTGNNRVQVFSLDGIFLTAFGGRGGRNGSFIEPCDVALDSNGILYVADRGNHRVQEFDEGGKFKVKLGNQGTGPKQFNALRGVAVNANDYIFTLESALGKNNRVQVFDPKHHLVLQFGSQGDGPGQFHKASNMTVRSQAFSEVYISDQGNHRLLVLAVKEVPDRPIGLTLQSDETSTVISWKKRPESFVKAYRVYYIPDDGSPPCSLGETAKPSFTVDYPLDPPGYSFRVNSVSTQGLESSPSLTITDNFQIAYLAWKAGEKETAEEKFLIHQNEFPSSALSLKYLGLVRMELGKDEEALRAFTELAKVPGYASEAHLMIGRAHARLANYSKAEAEFIKALKSDPENAEVYLARGELLLIQQLYSEAQRDLERSITLNPQNPEAHKLLGQCFYGQKLFKKAVQCLEQAIRLSPRDTSLYRSLARAHLGRKDSPGAIATLEKAIEIDPDDSRAMVMLGEIFLEKKEYAKVERQINLVLEKEPDNFQAHLLRGNMFASLGQDEDAIVELQNATNLQPDDLDALQALAAAYLKLNILQEAEKILKQVIELAPDLADAHLALARVLSMKGDAESAVSEYQRAIELAPKDISGHLELGRYYLESKQYSQAEVRLQRAISLVPDHLEAHLLLGRTYAFENKIGNAIREFQEAIRIDPNSAQVRFALGKLYLDTSQFDKAIPELELAAFIVSENAEYQNALGLAYFKMFRHDDAIEAFNRAMNLDSKNPEYKKNFNQVYQDRQKYLASEADLPPLEITDFQVGNVFSAIYKYYQGHPIGTIKLKNNCAKPIYKIKVSFQVSEYMDTAWYHEISQLKPHTSLEIKIYPVFNNKLLELTEDTPVLAEIIACYQVQKQPRQEKLTKPFTILKKSALTWSKKEMTGAFITPSDWPVKEFARGVYNLYTKDKFPMNEQIAHAMMLFDGLHAYRTTYLIDPNNPYGSASGEIAVDYIQYPRETLRLRSGDCDDLSILFCALLENLGIRTAIVDVPGHVFIMFETQVLAQHAERITSNPDLLVFHEGKVWIPVEVTLVGQSEFTSAWIKGAEVYRQWEAKEKINLIDTHASWEEFKPATLPRAEFQPHIPSRSEIDAIMEKEKGLQESKQKELIARAFKDKLSKNPGDMETRLQLGLAYAEGGYLADAKAEFETILKKDTENIYAITNLGSCALEMGVYKEAIKQYTLAEKLATQDAEIKINLAIAFYKQGNLKEAQAKFKEAKALDAALAQEFKTLENLLFH